MMSVDRKEGASSSINGTRKWWKQKKAANRLQILFRFVCLSRWNWVFICVQHKSNRFKCTSACADEIDTSQRKSCMRSCTRVHWALTSGNSLCVCLCVCCLATFACYTNLLLIDATAVIWSIKSLFAFSFCCSFECDVRCNETWTTDILLNLTPLIWVREKHKVNWKCFYFTFDAIQFIELYFFFVLQNFERITCETRYSKIF